jgi:hypothetical protein
VRRLIALVRKEARDARGLTIGAAVAALGLSVAAHEVWPDLARRGDLVAVWVIPALLALYVIAIAADLVASDAATRRIETAALLPVRTVTLWAAKALFLLGASTLFLAWVVSIQVVLHLLGGEAGSLERMRGAAGESALHLGGAVAAGAAVLFFSSIIDRGFAAAFAGVILLGTIGFGFVAIDWAALDLEPDTTAIALLAGGLTAIFVAASAIAFVAGRIQLGQRLRRGLVGAGALLTLLALPAGAGAWAVSSHLRLEPGDGEARLCRLALSPDERHLVVELTKDGQDQRRVWVLDLERERMRVLEDRVHWLGGKPWDHEGLLHVVRGRRERHDTKLEVHRWVDVTTGALDRARSQEQLDHEPLIARDGVRIRFLRAPTSGSLEVRAEIPGRGDRGWSLGWGRGVEPPRVHRTGNLLLPGPVTTHVDVRTGRQTPLPVGIHSIAGDGLHVLSFLSGEDARRWQVLDTTTGETIRTLPFRAGEWVRWVPDRDDARYLMIREIPTSPRLQRRVRLLDLEENREVELETWDLRVLRDGRLLTVDADLTTHLRDRDGKVLRRLCGPR